MTMATVTPDDAVVERRSVERFELLLHVDFMTLDSSATMQGTARNISLGGMFLETTTPCAYGTTILLRITATEGLEPLLAKATVRWTARTGMGVQFGPLGAKAVAAITDLRAGRS
jgi:hypothetical protein